MNVITPYEQLLAQEMDHLPLPGSMEDIWADIETQLDVELPSGGGKNPPPRKPAPARPTLRWTRHWRLFAIVGVVVVTVFLLVPKNKRHANSERNAIPPSKTELPDSLRPRRPAYDVYFGQPASPIRRTEGRGNNTIVPKDTGNKLPVPEPDSSVYIPPPKFIDTTANRPVNPLLINPAPDKRDNKPAGVDSSKSNSGGRKKRGVPDIGDSDYRIVPVRKDTPG